MIAISGNAFTKYRFMDLALYHIVWDLTILLIYTRRELGGASFETDLLVIEDRCFNH